MGVDQARHHRGAAEVDALAVGVRRADHLARHRQPVAQSGHTRALTSTTLRSAAMPGSTVCLTFDFDAMSVWFGYEHVTPAMLQRGEYGARVGVPRLLQMLERHELPATFFVPGHTLESFPEPSHAIVEAGHEVAHHSYAHVDPSGQPPDEERADMERALAALERLGVRPLGFRSPSADLSEATLTLLEEHGFLYDSSLMADDYRPYRPRIGDRVSRDTSRSSVAARRGCGRSRCRSSSTTGRTSSSTSTPRASGCRRRARCSRSGPGELDWMHEHVDGGVLVVTMHPQVIGRGHRMAMLERFVEHARGLGAEFAQMGEVAQRL